MKKHVRSPVWHTTPSPRQRASSSTVSWSQSIRVRTTCSRLPDVSPFVHSAPRVRLKNVAKPVRRVCSQASSFMKPTIRTSRVSASWTTAGTRPCSFEKSSVLIECSRLAAGSGKKKASPRGAGEACMLKRIRFCFRRPTARAHLFQPFGPSHDERLDGGDAARRRWAGQPLNVHVIVDPRVLSTTQGTPLWCRFFAHQWYACPTVPSRDD